MEDIRVLDGDAAVDDRGCLSFVNSFDFASVKRFYMVENFSTEVVRAFHGHLKEGKYVFVPIGSIILAAVRMSDTKAPDPKAAVSRFVLSARKPKIVYIPPGYANGFRALEQGTKVLFFSTSTLADSQGDDYRFPHDYWGAKVWEVENR